MLLTGPPPRNTDELPDPADLAARYHDFYENAPDMYLSIDVQSGAVADCNATTASKTGFRKAEIIGRPLLALYHPACHARARQAFQTFLATGEVRDVELQILCQEGRTLDVSLSASALRDAEGRIVRSRSIWHDISERKRMEAALAASEARFARLFYSSPVALQVAKAATGEIVDANNAAAGLLGYSREELIGRTFTDLGIVAPDTRAALLAEASHGLGTTLAVTCKSGAVKQCLVSVEPLEMDGEPCLLACTIDITAREQAERDHIFLSALIESSFDAIISRDMDGTIIGWNAGAERMFGYSAAEAIGLPVSTIVPPARQQEYRDVLKSLAQGIPVTATDTQRLHKDGHLVDVAFNTFVVRNAQGKALGISSIVHDISERKRAEAALQASEARLRMAARAAGLGIWLWDFGDSHIEWDERMDEFFSAAGAEHEAGAEHTAGDPHLKWQERLHPDDRERVAATMSEGRRTGAGWEISFRHILPGGAIRHFQAAALVERDAQDNPLRMIGVVQDITAQRLYEQQLQETNAGLEREVTARTAELRALVAELQHANASKDAFLAAVSHELRTPLAGVLAMAEMLASGVRGELNPVQGRYVAAIDENARRLLDTLNNILFYTRLIAGAVPSRCAVCRPAELCQVVVQSLAAKAEARRQQITQVVEPADLQLVSDEQMLRYILQVLIDNAIKFTPDGGAVEVAIGPAPSAQAVEIVVADTGIGMSAEELSGLFHPFEQADKTLARRYEGLGISLACVHRVVELLRGSITVSSAPGQGSRFCVTLPLANGLC